MDVHNACGKADAYAEDQCSMCDALSKRLRPTPFLVHMVWIEVPGLTGMEHDIRLGNGSARRAASRFHNVIFKICRIHHLLSRQGYRASSPHSLTSLCVLPEYF